jgi:hypothetical protein
MNETPTAITPGRKAAALVAQVINADPEPTACGLYGGTDPCGRGDRTDGRACDCCVHASAVLVAAVQPDPAEAHRRAVERTRMVERSRRLNEAARAGELAEKRKVMGY